MQTAEGAAERGDVEAERTGHAAADAERRTPAPVRTEQG